MSDGGREPARDGPQDPETAGTPEGAAAPGPGGSPESPAAASAPEGAREGPVDPALAPGVSIRHLTVRAGGQTLLEDASADFPAGGVTLLVGASGVGKTVLVKILAGLEDRSAVRTRGRVRVGGAAPRGGRRDVGIVFQEFALFDELGCRGNVTFALDHRPARRRRGDAAEDPAGSLLREFRIPEDVPVRALSGGQAQRLAVARALAHDPPVLIHDEPTSGLDPAHARLVARRIRETAAARGKTTVVVTHDYEHLAPVADAIWLLDPSSRSLREVSREELARLAGSLPATGPGEAGPAARTGLARRTARGALRALEETGAAAEAVVASLARLVPLWRSARWGLRYLLHYLALLASPSAWLYFAFAGLIAGFVATHFSFRFLPHSRITEPLIADEMLAALGTVLYRTLVPVLTTVLLAARSGAAVAADVGARSYTHQLDALRSFGVRPSGYLLTGILWAFLVVTPLLVGAAFVAAKATSLLVFLHDHPDKGAWFWDRQFHMALRIPGEALYRGTGWLVAKVMVCGLGVGGIAWHVASRPRRSSADVARGITGTIIRATLWVLIVHFAFAFFEYEGLVAGAR